MSTPNHVKTSVDAFELIMNGAIESLRRDIAGAGIEGRGSDLKLVYRRRGSQG